MKRRGGILIVVAGLSLAAVEVPDVEPGRVFEQDLGEDGVRRYIPAEALEIVPECEATCPAGLQIAAFDVSDARLYSAAIDQGAVQVIEGRCESLCTPIKPCYPPGVPVVTADEFRCEALEGFGSVPAPSDVDLSFGEVWEPEAHTP